MGTGNIGIGMVGAGFLAETRARCWARVAGVEARIEAVVASRRERAQAYAERHGVPTVSEDLDALLGNERVEAVDLCVPNDLHRPFAERAAAAGKHVICTKPLTAYVGQDLGPDATDAEVSGRPRDEMMALAVADAEAMVRATDEAGVQLLYGENWVYAPSIERAAGLLEASGGRALEMRGWEGHKGSHAPYAKSWRHAGGGALLRLGAHPIGAMLYLKRIEGQARLGAPIRPVAVSAEVADLSRVRGLEESATRISTGWVDVENWGCATISFDDGSRGVAYGSDVMLGGMESRLEVMGSNFHVKANLSPNDLLRAYAPDETVFEGEYLQEKLDGSAGWSTPMPNEDWTSGQLPMCEAFATDLAQGRPAKSNGALGVDVTRVVYGAYLSAAEGRRVTFGE